MDGEHSEEEYCKSRNSRLLSSLYAYADFGCVDVIGNKLKFSG